MTILDPACKGITYDSTLMKDKHFFAGYFNLAENNIETVFKTVYKYRFNLKQDSAVELLTESINTKISEPDYVERVTFLKQYFPVLHYLDVLPNNDLLKNSRDKIQAKREYLLKSFVLLINTINSLRNFYTHYYHAPLNLQPELYDLIDDLFLQVATDIKRQKKKNDHTKHLLKQSLKEEMAVLLKKKKLELIEKRENNNRVQLDNDSIYNAVFNDAFGHLLYKSKNSQIECLRDYYKAYCKEPTENGIDISQRSLLFLLGVFLSKKDSKDLRSRIRGFKGAVIKDISDFPNEKNSSLKFMVTHWVFSHLNVKPIRQKLNTSFIKETLLIQIVDELTKVPHEVYENLSVEEQERFVEDINEFIKEGNDTDTLDNSTVIHPIIRKRYEDKFNYFVLRYLDEYADFPSLRFQVHIGNYVHNRQLKQIVGTNYETERYIKEKINVFGKLSEISNLKNDYFLKESNEENLGLQMFPNPSYNLANGNIFIHFGLEDKQKQLIEPYKDVRYINEKRKKRNENKKDKEAIIHDVTESESIIVAEPIALLSLNELPSLLYELLIKKRTGKQIESVLRSSYLKRVNIIKKYTPGTLSNSQITKKLNNSSAIKSVDNNKFVNAMLNEITDTESKLQYIKSKIIDSKKERKKYILTGKELGAEATWLANDILRFMPLNSREQWKGYMHGQFQTSLAYYTQKPYEAFELLSSIWDFQNTEYTWGNTIMQVFKSNKIFEYFYLSYLEFRLSLYNTLKVQLEGFVSEKKRFNQYIKQQHIDHLFSMRLYTVDTTEEQKNKLLAKPIVFPRGIFDDKPTFIKGKNPLENPELFSDWYQYTYQQHSYQEFYDYERKYLTNFNEQRLVDEDFFINKKGFTEREQLELFKLKEDIRIKKVKGQDLFLKLIAEDLYERILGHKAELLLSELYKSSKQRYVSEITNVKSKPSEDDYPWNKTITYKEEQIENIEVKLKDINKVRRFLKDEKVKKLLSYDVYRKWSIQELENEIFIKTYSYETIRREELLKLLHGFEKYILQLNNFDGITHPVILENNNNPNFKFYITNGLLLKKGMANHNDVAWLLKRGENDFDKYNNEILSKPEIIQKAFLLILIRNNFAHNQLPIKEYFDMIDGFVKDKDEIGAVEIILLYVVTITEELMKYGI